MTYPEKSSLDEPVYTGLLIYKHRESPPRPEGPIRARWKAVKQNLERRDPGLKSEAAENPSVLTSSNVRI
jgi:hypothetical protein